jgi:L-lactate dehydrogenase complex protein LldF
MRRWREEAHTRSIAPLSQRWGLRLWAAAAKRPWLYHGLTRFAAAILGRLGRRRGAFRSMPLARGWTATRDLAAPQGRSFQQLWVETRRGVPR